MKKYFTKYLPVEGEIKEGDKTFECNGNLLPHTISKDELLFAIAQGDKKAKLFLCSRDIQVGNKVKVTKDSIHWFDDVVTDIVEKGYFTDSQEGAGSGYFYTSNQIFKVIGEISPEAVWVKEGDEFDEDEIEQIIKTFTWNKDYDDDVIEKAFKEFCDENFNYSHFVVDSITKWKDAPEEYTFKVFLNVYRIKGPCGHFH